jgi:3-isopropylmalate/(R)-2-methylmalate dehydratase small subunit
MRPFRKHRGLAVPLERADVDTDQIIPKQFLKRIERAGFGRFAFYDWRYLPDGSADAQFVLNRPCYAGASILLAGRNFGCGSSREHAPWALADFGFRCILAPSFADIFASNCLQNGLLTVALPEEVIQALIRRSLSSPGYMLTVDLESCTVQDDDGLSARFEVDPVRRQCLLDGLDEIDLTLRQENEIAAWESRHYVTSPKVRPLAE